jgi:FtsH-binding integral membrane protein
LALFCNDSNLLLVGKSGSILLAATIAFPQTAADMNPYSSSIENVIIDQPEETRASFIRKTYAHLAVAIAAFALLESLMQSMGLGEVALQLIGASRMSWLVVMVAFMGVSWLANKWALSSASSTTQYLGLGLYVVAEAVIFLPLIAIARDFDNNVIAQAAIVTTALVLGITVMAFTLKKDFSFLGGILRIGGFIMLGMIVASFFLPISLGFWFAAFGAVFAGGCILYDTSNIMHHYRPGQHVAASLSLFASVALMFWYILRLFMNRD